MKKTTDKIHKVNKQIFELIQADEWPDDISKERQILKLENKRDRLLKQMPKTEPMTEHFFGEI